MAGIVFTSAHGWAFWGIIVALILGVVALFRHSRRDGLILGAAAAVAFVAVFIIAVAHEVLSLPRARYTAKQRLVSELQTSFRTSLLNDNTKVLRVHNPNAESVDFYLKCYARDGSTRAFFVSAPALETKEIGILETGWQFKSGERVEAICDDAVIWHRDVE